MNIEYDTKDKLLVLKITEEIDHHTTEKIRTRADYEINRFIPRKIIFDFNNVTFMDSAGIGFLIGRYKEAKFFRRYGRNNKCKAFCKKNIGNVWCFKINTYKRKLERNKNNEKYI